MIGTIFLLGCILVLAHTVETLLGFGSTLIALALGVHLLPLETLVPVLVSLGLLQSLWLVGRWFRHINWRVLLLTILPLAAIGMVVGIYSREIADENTLKRVLGGFILIVSLSELAILFIKKTPLPAMNQAGHDPRRATESPVPRRPTGRLWGGQLSWYFSIPLLIGGGIFHGLFATGGPPIVYYASR